jgi:hydroxymethylpyrimidine pyrophosphatase-like HAD family hydrolase
VRYHALACDYDGTCASDGRVAPETLSALRAVRASGRKVLIVTGRCLEDLARVFPELGALDAVVAENGAVVFEPGLASTRVLGVPPRPALLEELRRRGVEPLEVGRVIVATREPHEVNVLEAIHALGLELQVVLNKGALMILPPGVNKASGLRAALDPMGIPLAAAVAVGDAENDLAMLAVAGCAVAVANALPSVKRRADLVTRGTDGEGIVELCENLLAFDLDGVGRA